MIVNSWCLTFLLEGNFSNLFERPFLFFNNSGRSSIVSGSTHNKVRWFPLQHRLLTMPGALLFSLYNPNHHVIIRRRLSPLPPRFTQSQVPVRACDKSHGILLSCEALETDETRQHTGCWVSSLGMAASSARSRGAVWHPLPPVPVGWSGKRKRRFERVPRVISLY